MPMNMDHFLTINSPSIESASVQTQEFFTSPAGILKTMLENQGVQALLGPGGGSGGSGGSGGGAARAAALKQLDIQKKRLLFQQKTGLRDIEQARARGLKDAINNALQRGIFRSGIRVENEEEVERESDEAASDLKTNIGFALEELAARRAGVSASGGGGGGGGGGAGSLTIDDLAQIATQPGIFESLDLGGGTDLNTIVPKPSASKGVVSPLLLEQLRKGGIQ